MCALHVRILFAKHSTLLPLNQIAHFRSNAACTYSTQCSRVSTSRSPPVRSTNNINRHENFINHANRCTNCSCCIVCIRTFTSGRVNWGTPSHLTQAAERWPELRPERKLCGHHFPPLYTHTGQSQHINRRAGLTGDSLTYRQHSI